VPQLTYKSIDPSTFKAGTTTTSGNLPKIIFEVTDSEGDLGFIPQEDTALIYIKNLKNNLSDSVFFPNTLPIVFKDFTATVEVTLDKPIFLQVPNSNVKDTIFYELYVKDFAKNKSNVIKCGPLYYIP
ncbi:MAG: hypothetical protein KA319_08480, partial [Ferruginibacter sp.]|nr:hypothetical protein [Ferruginibacter sp.]